MTSWVSSDIAGGRVELESRDEKIAMLNIFMNTKMVMGRKCITADVLSGSSPSATMMTMMRT